MLLSLKFISFLLVEVCFIIIELRRAKIKPKTRTGVFVDTYTDITKTILFQSFMEPGRIAKEKPFHNC